MMFIETDNGLFEWIDYPERRPLTKEEISTLQLIDPELIIIIFVNPERLKNENSNL